MPRWNNGCLVLWLRLLIMGTIVLLTVTSLVMMGRPLGPSLWVEATVFVFGQLQLFARIPTGDTL
jgi:hypothetical protein